MGTTRHQPKRRLPSYNLIVTIVVAFSFTSQGESASFTISRSPSPQPRGRTLDETVPPRPEVNPRAAYKQHVLLPRGRRLEELGVQQRETLLSGTIIIEQPEAIIGPAEIYIEDGMDTTDRRDTEIDRRGVDTNDSSRGAENATLAASITATGGADGAEAEGAAVACDIRGGVWEADDNRPLYSSRDCPFIHSATQCDEHGRPDTGYQKLRWRPTGFNTTTAGGCGAMPRLTANSACELMRHRNIAYVGDSIVRNHFNSLACIMFGTQGDPEVLGSHPYAQVYHWPRCNATVAFYWSHFLVNLTLIDEHVFNTGGQLDLEHPDDWWFQHYHEHETFVISAGQWWSKPRIQGKNIHFAQPHSDASVMDAYQTALFSVLRPFSSVRSTGKQVVLTLVPPTHGFHGSCPSTEPVTEEAARSKDYPEEKYNVVLADVARRYEARRAKRGHGAPLMLLDVFGMSLTRWDGHPGKYSGGGHMDCGHYCLPGVPDSWNEMMLGMMWLQDGRGGEGAERTHR